MTRRARVPALLLAWLLAWLLAGAVGLAPAGARASQRVALVIGNAGYVYTEPLASPVEDAAAMAETLRKLDFKVMEYQDLDRIHMERAFRGFARALGDAKVALFYYAGHALQVDGENFLVPIDAELASDLDLDILMTSLNIVLRMMAGRTPVGLVFLDASRVNPLADVLSDAREDQVSVGRGLAPVDPAPNTLIAFAAAPGRLAPDRDWSPSPFTEAMLNNMETPGLDIGGFMERLRADLKEKGASEPWSRSTLAGDGFAFVDPKAGGPTAYQEIPPEPAGRVPPLMDRDALFWAGIRESEDWRDYQAYLDRFGEGGAFAPLAILRRDRLRAPEATEPPPGVPLAAAEPMPEPAPEPEPELADEPPPDPAPEIAGTQAEPEPAAAVEPTDAPAAEQPATEAELAEAPLPEIAAVDAPAPEPLEEAPAVPARPAQAAPEPPSPEELAELPPIGEPWGDEPWGEGEAGAAGGDGSEPDPLAPLKFREAGLASEIKERIQVALTGLGLYDGPIDGLFGAGTRSSIKAFQAAEGALETGYLAQEQQDRLFAKAEAAARQASLEPDTPAEPPASPEPPVSPEPAASPEPASAEPAADSEPAPAEASQAGETAPQAPETAKPVVTLGAKPRGTEPAETAQRAASEPPPSPERRPAIPATPEPPAAAESAPGESAAARTQTAAAAPVAAEPDLPGPPTEEPAGTEAPAQTAALDSGEPEIDWMARAREVVINGREDFEEQIKDYNRNRNLFSTVTSSHDTRIDRIRGLKLISADSFGAKVEATITNKSTVRHEVRTITVTLDTQWNGEALRIVGHR